MTHSEFVAAYQNGSLKVRVPPKPAGRYLAGRMWLPWILLPLFGIAVASALQAAWLFCALAFGLALALRTLVRATAPGYILQRALQDPPFYEEIKAAGLLETWSA